jgi:hypothetical protein
MQQAIVQVGVQALECRVVLDLALQERGVVQVLEDWVADALALEAAGRNR